MTHPRTRLILLASLVWLFVFGTGWLGWVDMQHLLASHLP
jgi:hypothetical protein